MHATVFALSLGLVGLAATSCDEPDMVEEEDLEVEAVDDRAEALESSASEEIEANPEEAHSRRDDDDGGWGRHDDDGGWGRRDDDDGWGRHDDGGWGRRDDDDGHGGRRDDDDGHGWGRRDDDDGHGWPRNGRGGRGGRW